MSPTAPPDTPVALLTPLVAADLAEYCLRAVGPCRVHLVGAELFPLAPFVTNAAQGIGIIGSFGLGFSLTNVTVECADGSRGWQQRAPFDVIVLSGAVPRIPAELLKQLRVGGRLAAIVGEAPVMEAQMITCVADGVYNTVNLFETVVPVLDNFVPTREFSL